MTKKSNITLDDFRPYLKKKHSYGRKSAIFLANIIFFLVLSASCLPLCRCLGRLALPERLPFSKPKVNWLLHPEWWFASLLKCARISAYIGTPPCFAIPPNVRPHPY